MKNLINAFKFETNTARGAKDGLNQYLINKLKSTYYKL